MFSFFMSLISTVLDMVIITLIFVVLTNSSITVQNKRFTKIISVVTIKKWVSDMMDKFFGKKIV